VTAPQVEACRAWLRANGWSLHPFSDDAIEVYARGGVVDDDGAPILLHLPVRADVRDAAGFVTKLIRLLATVQGVTEAAIVEDIRRVSGRAPNPRDVRRRSGFPWMTLRPRKPVPRP